jgi:hypothetical protein
MSKINMGVVKESITNQDGIKGKRVTGRSDTRFRTIKVIAPASGSRHRQGIKVKTRLINVPQIQEIPLLICGQTVRLP